MRLATIEELLERIIALEQERDALEEQLEQITLLQHDTEAKLFFAENTCANCSKSLKKENM